MWFQVKIIIYIFSIMLLPYLLAGVILRIATPKIKAILVAILATLFIAYLDQQYYLFGNIVQFSNTINSSLYSQADFELEKAGFPFYIRFIMTSLSTLIGRMIILFCFARLGVLIMDKIKEKKNNHAVPQGIIIEKH